MRAISLAVHQLLGEPQVAREHQLLVVSPLAPRRVVKPVMLAAITTAELP
jgi:hypothetical protein